MGVRNLWDILESCKKTLPLHHLQNKRVCVDLSCWLVQFHAVCRTPTFLQDKVYLRNLFHRVRALIALNCSLIFVTDGAIPSIKLSTYRRRLGSSSEVTKVEENKQPMLPLRRNKGSEFSRMIKEAKTLGTALGIPCLDALEEAEAQCALLNSSSLCDGCFTSDSDAFLFGARTVYRDVILGEGGYVVCYEMEDIEKNLGFGRNSLISLGLLLGSDYSNRVHGVGPEMACKFVKSKGDRFVLQHIASEGVETIKRIKAKKNAENSHNDVTKEVGLMQKTSTLIEKGSQPDNPILEVINAYLKPKCHSPASEPVESVCSQQPFLRLELHQICEKYFGWSPDKTDEYILPKIAERELRRYESLCSATSALGVSCSSSEMPIKCPINSIIKQRLVRGNEHYEVSLSNINGLEVAILPGELVKSACPEKVSEFMAKMEEKKTQQKRKPLQKKPRAKAQATDNMVNDMGWQLESLILSHDSPRTALSDVTNRAQTVVVERLQPDVIDLLSPSPPVRARKLTKALKSVPKNVDIVDICDSDNDVSPEHQRKARELRLFIESMKNNLW